MLAKRPVFLVAQATVGKFIETFKDFPPRQRPSTFTIDQAMEKLKQNLSNQQRLRRAWTWHARLNCP